MLSPSGESKIVVSDPCSGIQLLSKGTARDLQSKPLLKVGSTLNSNRVAQGFVHLSLENLQGWAFHSLSGTPLTCPISPAPSCCGYPCSLRAAGQILAQLSGCLGPAFCCLLIYSCLLLPSTSLAFPKTLLLLLLLTHSS